ncbi:MAG TPA: ribonuclease P protein component [Marmoricola sp.]|nr:ribonuclease P protein component [Marmoricola sp.]
MLARAQRLTSSQEFVAVTRRGRRAGSSTLVLHVVVGDGEPDGHPPRVGLVVGRAIGNAVMRNQVKRRLRHLLRERLSALPNGTLLVVRALSPAGAASSTKLAADLDSALSRVLHVKGAA